MDCEDGVRYALREERKIEEVTRCMLPTRASEKEDRVRRKLT